MSTRMPAVIELVDAEIVAVADGGPPLKTTGYALLDDDGIATGGDALARAWLYPQRCFSQFWHQLTLAPLPVDYRHARHYADLAFAQLRDIHRQLGAPEEVIFLLPGSFSRDQLSILLGLANALPVTTAALVDNAVAAVSTVPHEGDILHVDIHLHQAVITHLEVTGKVSRVAVEIVPDAGLRAFYGAWCQAIADQFIEQYRYDPLHLAADEQQLNDRLPGWLAAVDADGQHTAELQSRRGNFRVNLGRQVLAARAGGRIDRLRETLEKFPAGAKRVGSHRLNRLPGVAAALGLELLDATRALRGCLTAAVLDRLPGAPVPYITELAISEREATSLPPGNSPKAGQPGPAGNAPAASDALTTTETQAASGRPSHLLIGHRAHAIGAGLGVRSATGQLEVSRERNVDLWLFPGPGGIAAESTNAPAVTVDGDPHNLNAGDRLHLDGHVLTLIAVDREA